MIHEELIHLRIGFRHLVHLLQRGLTSTLLCALTCTWDGTGLWNGSCSFLLLLYLLLHLGLHQLLLLFLLQFLLFLFQLPITLLLHFLLQLLSLGLELRDAPLGFAQLVLLALVLGYEEIQSL